MNSNSCYSKVLNLFLLSLLLLAPVLWLAPVERASAAASGKTFASPEDAVGAFTTAINNRDTNALAAIFGPEFDDLQSPDPVQAQNEMATVAQRLKESHHLDRVASDRYILDMGKDKWPFSIPIVQKGSSWYFDTEAGKDELLNRRIGRNELDVLKSVRAYADAQREYASKDRNGDEVLEYAQNLRSSPGAKDGLYWPPESDGEMSPLGPLYAEAQGKGYFKETQNTEGPQPFDGYFFKILKSQGKNAPGGAHDYIVNGHMINGFALVAWPAEYGDSGIMTFVINQQGKVYQKDLGKDTASIVEKMKAYDPDKSWTVSPD